MEVKIMQYRKEQWIWQSRPTRGRKQASFVGCAHNIHRCYETLIRTENAILIKILKNHVVGRHFVSFEFFKIFSPSNCPVNMHKKQKEILWNLNPQDWIKMKFIEQATPKFQNSSHKHPLCTKNLQFSLKGVVDMVGPNSQAVTLFWKTKIFWWSMVGTKFMKWI